MTDWYRQSRWQLECGQTLWQDLQQHYSSSDWQQRSRRLAYQTAILQYLKKAVQALMAALASDNNFGPIPALQLDDRGRNRCKSGRNQHP